MNKNKRYDWSLIQAAHNSGLTQRELQTKFGVTMRAISSARKRGDFISRDNSQAQIASRKANPRTHSLETKEKLREHMVRRLKEGTYPTLGKNFRGRPKSYPEQWWETVIAQHFSNTNYVDEYQIGLYSLDFAWIAEKKCIEIDGSQHNEPAQQASDRRKDEFLISNGWQVLRMPWLETLKDKQAAIAKAKQFIDGEYFNR